MNKNNYLKVLLATWLGWLFDGFDSSLYPLVANSALSEIIGQDNADFGYLAAKALAIFLFGWALGGIIFGFIGDRFGRAKALSYSILTYAIFTGLTGLVHSWEQLTVFRFLAGLGVGGEWALGVALLAEWSNIKNRISSTAFLATGASIGWILAIIVNYLISLFGFGWRWVFFIGIIPAALVFFIRQNITEPESWVCIKNKISNPFEIFSSEYLRNLIIAFLLSVAFSLGAWGCVVFWLPLWIERTLNVGTAEKTITMIVLMSSFTAGCYVGSYFISLVKKKTALFSSFFITFISAACLYTFFKSYSIFILIVVSVLGFFHGMMPGAFAVYFPELFPIRIRATAQGFCFNVGRALAGIGVLFSGYLVERFNEDIGKASALMSLIFLVGAIVSFFAPETKKDLSL